MALEILYSNPGLPVVYRLDADPTTFPSWGGTNAEQNSVLYRTDVPSVYLKNGALATDWLLVGISSASIGGTPSTILPDDVANGGVSTSAARSDHIHAIAAAAAIQITDATSNEGVSTSFARADHAHAHGDRGGGTLHALFTAAAAGFMGQMVTTTPARVLDTPFKPSATRPTLCIYTIGIQVEVISTGAGSIGITGAVSLLSDDQAIPVTRRAIAQASLTANLAVAGNSITLAPNQQLIYLVPPNDFVLLDTFSSGAGPIFTLVDQTEITL